MKANELLKHVRYIQKVVKGNATLPVCDCLLIKDGKLTGTDLVTMVTVDLKLEGDCLVEARQLNKILSVLDGEVKFKNLSEDVVQITDGKKKYKLTTISVGEFPKKTAIGEKIFTFNEKDIQALVIATKFTCNDELRPVLNGICIDKKNIVSTDAHKMYYPKLSKVYPEEGFVLPCIAGVLADKFKTLDVYKNKDRYTLKQGIYELQFRAIDGKYPNWKAIISEKAKRFIEVDKKELLGAIKGAEPCLNPATKMLSIQSKGTAKVVIGAEDLGYGNEFEEILASRNKGKVDFCVNAHFLREIVSATENEKTTLYFKAANRAILVNDDFLLMPVMNNKY